MTATSLALLICCLISASFSLETRNISTEVSSFQTVTVVNNRIVTAEVLWNTKSVNTVGWTTEGAGCKFLSPRKSIPAFDRDES